MVPWTAPLAVAACALVLAAMPFAAPSQAQDKQAFVPDGFAKTDTNQSGEVDPDEFRARILEIFRILDANQDGRIALLEVVPPENPVGRRNHGISARDWIPSSACTRPPFLSSFQHSATASVGAQRSSLSSLLFKGNLRMM